MAVEFQTGIWAESWRVMRLNAKYVLLYVAAMLLLDLLLEVTDKDKPKLVVQAIIAPLLAIPAGLTSLRNVPGFDVTALDRFTGYMLRGLFVFVLPYILHLLLFMFLLRNLASLWFLVVLAKPVLWLVVEGAAVAMLGTVLPAVITDQDRSLYAAGQRGLRTFGFSFPCLLVSLAILAFPPQVLNYGPAGASISGGRILLPEGGADIPLVLATIVANTIGAFGLVMTAVILSRAFLMAEGKTSLAPQ